MSGVPGMQLVSKHMSSLHRRSVKEVLYCCRKLAMPAAPRIVFPQDHRGFNKSCGRYAGVHACTSCMVAGLNSTVRAPPASCEP